MAALMRRLWGMYEHHLRRRPIPTQMASSTILWGVGDVLAQKLGENREEVDWRRTGITALFGTAFVGPVGHIWYVQLDKVCKRLAAENTPKFVVYKVGLDTAILGPLYIAGFLAWGCAFIDRGGMQEFKDKMVADFPSLMAASLAVWPAFQAVNFSVVPLRHQLLAVNGMTLLDASFLSWARNQEDWWGTITGAILK